MACSRNLAESAVALLAVLGSRSVQVLATETWNIGGVRAWRLAIVSSKHLHTEISGGVFLSSCI